MIIRNQPTAQELSRALTNSATTDAPRPSISVKRQKRKSSLSWTSLASYFGVFLLVSSLVAISYHPPVKTPLATAGSTVQTAAPVATIAKDTSVDQLMATNIAAVVSESAGMPITNNVASLSQSLTVESLLAQTDTSTISKPQIVQVAADSRSEVQHTAVAGDTAPTLAQKYGVSAQTIKWANSLTSDAIEPGKVLTIPPVDGIVYTVKAGDTVDSIAGKYKADKDRLVAFNDLELVTSLEPGTKVTIPGGDLPENERPGYVAPRATPTARVNAGVSYGNYSGGYGTSWVGGASGGNRYAYGQCTWYAYERRAQLGNPVGGMWGNANTWAYAGAASGFLVDGNPTPGAIMANGGGYGHVAIVESVNPGVSVTISEMNGYRFGGGWNRVGHGNISWSEAVSGMYKYIH